MYNFDQTFLAKINGTWTGVNGQILLDRRGYNYLICKHNGFIYCLLDGYEQFNDNITEEEMRAFAVQYNTADLDSQIARQKLAAQNPIGNGVGAAIQEIIRNARRIRS